MSQLTTVPIGYGNFYGDSYGGAYAWALGSQAKYDALSDTVKASILVGYTTTAEIITAINSTTLTAPLNIILLEPMDLTGIPASKDGFAITVIIGYAKKQNMNSYKMALAYSM